MRLSRPVWGGGGHLSWWVSFLEKVFLLGLWFIVWHVSFVFVWRVLVFLFGDILLKASPFWGKYSCWVSNLAFQKLVVVFGFWPSCSGNFPNESPLCGESSCWVPDLVSFILWGSVSQVGDILLNWSPFWGMFSCWIFDCLFGGSAFLILVNLLFRHWCSCSFFVMGLHYGRVFFSGFRFFVSHVSSTAWVLVSLLGDMFLDESPCLLECAFQWFSGYLLAVGFLITDSSCILSVERRSS